MKIEIQFIDNPQQCFWIQNEKYSSLNPSRLYPRFTSNVASGKTVAVYMCSSENTKMQIAQLSYPNYTELQKLYNNGGQIDLTYTYIDNFSWLGNQKAYELEGQPYKVFERFSSACSFWDNSKRESSDYFHIMQSQISMGNLDFTRSYFNNINLCFTNLSIPKGNLQFDYSHFFESQISVLETQCGGNIYFPSEISFRYIAATSSDIHLDVLGTKTSIDFLLSKIDVGKVEIDGLPYGLNDLCFTKANIPEVNLTNCDLNSIDIREATIDTLQLTRCVFNGICDISSQINKLTIENSVIANAFRFDLPSIKELGFDNTLNNGKLYIKNFPRCLNALMFHINSSNIPVEDQLLMLKENFAQLGEYKNEDLCHLQFQRKQTNVEKHSIKKIARITIDGISGYGTKPQNMFLFIILTILGFATMFYLLPSIRFKGITTLFDYIYVSGITFFTVGYGDIVPITSITKCMVLIESFVGVATMSYFLVVLSRKVIR